MKTEVCAKVRYCVGCGTLKDDLSFNHKYQIIEQIKNLRVGLMYSQYDSASFFSELFELINDDEGGE